MHKDVLQQAIDEMPADAHEIRVGRLFDKAHGAFDYVSFATLQPFARAGWDQTPSFDKMKRRHVRRFMTPEEVLETIKKL